jgi:hypothetical protein
MVVRHLSQTMGCCPNEPIVKTVLLYLPQDSSDVLQHFCDSQAILVESAIYPSGRNDWNTEPGLSTHSFAEIFTYSV